VFLTLVAYMSLRNLDGLSWQRLLTSGGLTLGAGVYFWHLSRKQKRIPAFAYGLFTAGITLSLLCGSIFLVKYGLTIPLTPSIVLWIFALPPLGFYLYAEYRAYMTRKQENSALPDESDSSHQMDEASDYVSHSNYAFQASCMLSLCLLLFYLVPQFIRFLLLPEYGAGFLHYSQHAPLALALGLLFIRLHALGGGRFLVFTGMLVDVAALFFLAIRIPDVVFGIIPQLSAGKTFEFFALVMIVLSYLLLIVTHGDRRVTTLIRKFGAIDDGLWCVLKHVLLLVLLSVSHLWFLLMLVNFDAELRLVGILFLLLAGLWVYAGYTLRTMLAFSLAYLETVAAIFSC
jgi:hypothetical protein